MMNIEEKKDLYYKTLANIRNLGLPKEFHEKNRIELIVKTVEISDKLCQRLEKMFNDSDNESEQIFFALELKSIQSDLDNLVLNIIARSEAMQVIEL